MEYILHKFKLTADAHLRAHLFSVLIKKDIMFRLRINSVCEISAMENLQLRKWKRNIWSDWKRFDRTDQYVEYAEFEWKALKNNIGETKRLRHIFSRKNPGKFRQNFYEKSFNLSYLSNSFGIFFRNLEFWTKIKNFWQIAQIELFGKKFGLFVGIFNHFVKVSKFFGIFCQRV